MGSRGGAAGGYRYSIWSSGSGGGITPYGVDAAFEATWYDWGDFLARVGLSLDSDETLDELGTITAYFSETKSGTAGDFSYLPAEVIRVASRLGLERIVPSETRNYD